MLQYTLEVYGYLWSGPRAVYSYNVQEPVKTDQEAKRHAGDFESLIDWRLVECSTIYEKSAPNLSRRVDQYRTLRGFRSGKMTPRRFYRLANGY